MRQTLLLWIQKYILNACAFHSLPIEIEIEKKMLNDNKLANAHRKHTQKQIQYTGDDNGSCNWYSNLQFNEHNKIPSHAVVNTTDEMSVYYSVVGKP